MSPTQRTDCRLCAPAASAGRGCVPSLIAARFGTLDELGCAVTRGLDGHNPIGLAMSYQRGYTRLGVTLEHEQMTVRRSIAPDTAQYRRPVVIFGVGTLVR